METTRTLLAPTVSRCFVNLTAPAGPQDPHPDRKQALQSHATAYKPLTQQSQNYEKGNYTYLKEENRIFCRKCLPIQSRGCVLCELFQPEPSQSEGCLLSRDRGCPEWTPASTEHPRAIWLPMFSSKLRIEDM